MSTGVVVSDVAALGRLALSVYRKCRDSPGEYKNLAGDCREISNLSTDIEDAIRARQQSQLAEADLLRRTKECRVVLQDLEERLDKYNNLPLQSRRTWDRLQWDQQEGGDIFVSIKEGVQSLTTFYQSLSQSDEAVVEKALEQLATEIRRGRGDVTSVITFGTSNCEISNDDDFGWGQISKDLEDFGVSPSLSSENKRFIGDWISRAINMGWLEEKIPVDDGSNAPIPVSPQRSPAGRSSISRKAVPSPAYAPSPILPEVHHPSLHPAASLRVKAPVTPTDFPPSPRGLRLQPQVSFEDLRDMNIADEDQPPSPIEQEDSNILWNAQRILEHWNKREWAKARGCLVEQIDAVNRGHMVMVGNTREQPDIRLLNHLIGVCYSYDGDLLNAKKTFETVIRVQGIFGGGVQFDGGDIAASRWLGETCIMLNQPMNAALAWAISLVGVLNKYGYTRNVPSTTMQDLRNLDDHTSGLVSLKGYFTKFNRDATSILKDMRPNDKYNVIVNSIENVRNYTNVLYTSNHAPAANIDVAEGFLTQPLAAYSAWPLQQDPFFRTKSSITLASILGKRRMEFNFTSIQTMSYGVNIGKKMAFITNLGIHWLVETLKLGLNTYGIEWKVHYSKIYCRISHSHHSIAYYEVYAIEFRKHPFRNMYGFKISERLYTTRGFVGQTLSERFAAFPADEDHEEKTKEGLATTLSDFLGQAERHKADGTVPPWEEPDPQRAPYELPTARTWKPGVELPANQISEADSRAVAEAPQRVTYEMGASEFIAELPA